MVTGYIYSKKYSGFSFQDDDILYNLQIKNKDFKYYEERNSKKTEYNYSGQIGLDNKNKTAEISHLETKDVTDKENPEVGQIFKKFNEEARYKLSDDKNYLTLYVPDDSQLIEDFNAVGDHDDGKLLFVRKDSKEYKTYRSEARKTEANRKKAEAKMKAALKNHKLDGTWKIRKEFRKTPYNKMKISGKNVVVYSWEQDYVGSESGKDKKFNRKIKFMTLDGGKRYSLRIGRMDYDFSFSKPNVLISPDDEENLYLQK